jgi:hypothetical protein
MYLSDRFREIYFTEKMEYNPDKYHRRSIRLKWYDYAGADCISPPYVQKTGNVSLGRLGMGKCF